MNKTASAPEATRRALLACGVVAGPLYVVVGAIEFTAAVVLAWTWISAMAARLLKA